MNFVIWFSCGTTLCIKRKTWANALRKGEIEAKNQGVYIVKMETV